MSALPVHMLIQVYLKRRFRSGRPQKMASWLHLGGDLGILAHLGPVGGHLGPSWGHLGTILAVLLAILGSSWRASGV